MAKGKFVKALVEAAEKAGKLDMSEAARMARAREMGFMTDMPVFHGTNKDIPEFSLERGGEVSRSPVGKQGVSLSTDPETASEFANQAGGEGQNVIQAYHRASKPARIELDGTETNLEISATVQDAWDQGFDAIKFDNYTTPKGEKGRSFVLVRDPNQIRSVNAAFDPAKKDSPNLLASILPAAAGVGGTAALLGQPESAQAMPEPKGKFAKSLMDTYLKQQVAKPMTPDERLQYGQGFGYQDKIEPVRNEWAAKAAEYSEKYNKWRRENVHPVVDMALPVGELPADVLRKMSYGDKVRYMDSVMAGLGML